MIEKGGKRAMTSITFEKINNYFVERWIRHKVDDGDLVDALCDSFLHEFANRLAVIKKDPKQKENLAKAVNALNYKPRGFETKNYSRLCELFALKRHDMQGLFLIAVVENFLKDKRKRRDK